MRHHIRPYINRTVEWNNLYLDSTMNWFSLGAGEIPDIPNAFILSLSPAEKLGFILPRGSY
jgi:hypothetical protein